MGKRLIIAQETEEGRKLSSQALKKLSSTDPITERPLYENERTFTPSHTLIMATNFLPRVGSTDDGTWRRIMVVPFRACIADGVQIKGYADVMYEADRDAILAWIVEGAKRMLASGCRLVPPRCVEEMTQSYKSAEDWLGNFLDECCDVGHYSTPGSDLYSVYTRWAENANEHPRRARDFAAALEARGFVKRKTMTNNMWDGLQVNVNNAIDKISGWFYGG
jgi:putative DNA primase/helicase